MTRGKGFDFRRRREALTDYKKRFALVKSSIERVVVRKTNKRIIGQIVKYSEEGDKVIAYADSSLLKKYNWPSRSNRPTAYLTGMLLAKMAKNGEECILDIGLSSSVKNSIPFVFAKGCIDGGLKLKANLDMKEDVYNYSNINHLKELKEKNQEKFSRQYGGYLKEKVNPESLSTLFNQVKEKIMSE